MRHAHRRPRWRTPVFLSLLFHAVLVTALFAIARPAVLTTERQVAAVRALPFDPPDEPDADAPEEPTQRELPEDVTPRETPEPLPEVLPPEDVTPPEEPPPVRVPDSPDVPAPDVVGLPVRVRTRPRADPPPAEPPVSVPAPARAYAGSAPPPRPPLVAIESPDPPVVPEIPVDARVTVTLEYTIAADGRVVDVRVAVSSGYPTQDAATRDFVASRWRYVPPGTDRRVVRRFVFLRRA